MTTLLLHGSCLYPELLVRNTIRHSLLVPIFDWDREWLLSSVMSVTNIHLRTTVNGTQGQQEISI